MGDAYTDMAQDGNLNQKLYNLEKLEKDFFLKPTKGLARKIIHEFSNYMKMGRGYDSSPAMNYSKDMISLFGQWLYGEISTEEVKDYLEKSSKLVNTATGYRGFPRLNLEGLIFDKVEKGLGKTLRGENIFLSIEEENNTIKIKYDLVSEDFEKKREDRIKNYEKYLSK